MLREGEYTPEMSVEFNRVPLEEVRAALESQRIVREFAEFDRRERAVLFPLPTHQEIERQVQERLKSKKHEPSPDDLLLGNAMVERLTIHREVTDQYQELYQQHYEVSRKYLEEVLNILDTQAVWQHRFTTGDRPTPDWSSSIYYMSEHGISYRLKTALMLEQGLAGVKQQIADRVLFVDRDNNHPDAGMRRQFESDFGTQVQGVYASNATQFVPCLGFGVEEFFSSPFRAMQHGELSPDSLSSVRVYEEDNTILVLCDDMDGHHPGHGVNSIAW